ncbi:hypothetical protein F8M41_000478 [Gigaspora margarita]|uniref:Zn(2)-C6 fungal-type domain-containing protein n=1 Tax=Gigaspora margarita TaxID=4874 RepID=A0A8H4ESN3_GIGMA|nr:hypothetical protein F8M41_000478 [Gigaspora margarita]
MNPQKPKKKPACSYCHGKKIKCAGIEVNFDDNGYVPELTNCEECKTAGEECIITIPHCPVCNKKFGKNDAIRLCQECKLTRKLKIAMSNLGRTISTLEQAILSLEIHLVLSVISVISLLEKEKSSLEQTIQKLTEGEMTEGKTLIRSPIIKGQSVVLIYV